VFCSKCGGVLGADVAFCMVCGTPVPQGAFAPAAAPSSPGAVAAYAGGLLAAPAVTYAGFWLRFVAHLVDGLIIGFASMVLFVPFIFLTGIAAHVGTLDLPRHAGEPPNPALIAAFFSVILVFVGVSVLVQWLYYAYLESGEKQATWGKQLLGLYVTDVLGRRISFARATGRYFAKIVSGLIPLGIGYIMAGFTARKQALHDMIADTLVLRR